MEMKEAFGVIVSRTAKALEKAGYEKQSVSDSENNGDMTALFTSKDTAYSVVYLFEKKRVVLRICGMNDSEPDNAWKTAATWLFDPDADTMGDAENIGNDFAETIEGPKQVSIQRKRKLKKEGESTSDPLFFANRMVAYFPELRDEIAYEKAHYTSFRGITFAEEHILPKFCSYVSHYGETTLEKFSKNLSELYDAGDLDVKGIITYVLLNAIDDDEKFEQVTSQFEKDQKKIAVEVRRLRGKKIKPEKPKKPSRFVADTLNSYNK